MFKFKLEQTIFYMHDNRVHSARVLSRMVVENLHDDWVCNKEQESAFGPFGPSQIIYNTCHGLVTEANAYESKEALAEDL